MLEPVQLDNSDTASLNEKKNLTLLLRIVDNCGSMNMGLVCGKVAMTFSQRHNLEDEIRFHSFPKLKVNYSLSDQVVPRSSSRLQGIVNGQVMFIPDSTEKQPSLSLSLPINLGSISNLSLLKGPHNRSPLRDNPFQASKRTPKWDQYSWRLQGLLIVSPDLLLGTYILGV